MKTEQDRIDKKAKDTYSIAIDGPSGAGKSTLARALAETLGIGYLDTGAMYRALGFTALKRKLAPSDQEKIAKMLGEITLDIRFDAGVQRTLINGCDVSRFIRTPEVSMAASDISALPAARYFCVERQRALAGQASFVLDGRDIGTFVLPGADVKFFLTASFEERAKRRLADLHRQGISDTFENVLAEMQVRDSQDSLRKLAPTRAADDAVIIDSTALSPEDVLQTMLAVCRDRGIRP